MSETRKAGDYEITQSIHIGDKEIVMGENIQDKDGNFYFVADYTHNDLFAAYENCLISSDFIEIAEIYTNRMQSRINKLKEEQKKINVPKSIITAEMCCPLKYTDSIENKVIAIKLNELRPEYRIASEQLYIVTGGFGAYGNSRGRTVYCKNLYNGTETRFDRSSVQGVIKPSFLPEWARDKLKIEHDKQRNSIKPKQHKRQNPIKEMER